MRFGEGAAVSDDKDKGEEMRSEVIKYGKEVTNMPGKDGKGPQGMGPKTGKGLGKCNSTNGLPLTPQQSEMRDNKGPGHGNGQGQGSGQGGGRGKGRGKTK
jgi:hypothetical protein